jgi:SAM-dependent methyltransferase
MSYLSQRASKKQRRAVNRKVKEIIYGGDALSREDESDDREFYAVDRFVSHLDDTARATVERLVGSLVVEDAPVILDLMASWDSHIPAQLAVARVVGLGLNSNELAANEALDEWLVHDLNRDPKLPFPDASFDVVLNTVSVEYLTQPFAVFREIARVLKPGGFLLVVFSDRMFPEKSVHVWRYSSEQERIMIVEDFVNDSLLFEAPRVWVSKGLPRPAGDRYHEMTETSDPVLAVAAVREGGPERERPFPSPPVAAMYTAEEVAARSRAVGETLRCPHCDQPLARWQVPQTPYTNWDAEHVYICANNHCPYMLRGWQAMSRQGIVGSTYRLLYDPVSDRCRAIAISSHRDLSTPG